MTACKECYFKNIYLTSIEKQVVTTNTNLSLFCLLGTTRTECLQGRRSTSQPWTPQRMLCPTSIKKMSKKFTIRSLFIFI